MRRCPRFCEACHVRVGLRVDTDGNGVNDAWEDSNGDSVFNIQELLIGKNPSVRDVLGIHLKVCLGFPDDNSYMSQLKRAFHLASKYIYDYTDGYAFISNIEIYNNSSEYNSCTSLSSSMLTISHTLLGARYILRADYSASPPQMVKSIQPSRG